jgi:7-carboxy-7-deazaguanine synthase
MGNEAILQEVAQHAARHVVVTGGEPMLFAPVVPLTEALKERGQHITIETAGTVYQPVTCDLMSISPKLANSTPEGEWSARHDAARYRPEILGRLMEEFDYQLKFVISSPADLDEVQSMLGELRADRGRVMLMPEGTTPETTGERAQWLAEICKREGFRYSPRLHVDIWGDKRGV